MAEDGLRIGGLSSGLAVLLNGEGSKENSLKTHLVSNCDDFGYQSVERSLEYVLGLPNKSVSSLASPVDSNLVRCIIQNEFPKLHANSSVFRNRDGVCISGDGCTPHIIGLDESSIRGDIC